MNEAMLTRALEKRYYLPEWAFLAQVSDRTGGASRYADGVAMNLYPSRGLEIRGFEIKIHRGDLIKELKTPDKAEEIARFCNSWYLVTPEKLVKPEDEIPAGWGIIEVKDDESLRQVKKPLHRDADMVTKDFVASLLRRAAERDKKDFEKEVERAVEQRLAARLESTKRQKTYEHDRALEEVKRLREQINTFEEASGMKLSGYDGPRRYGEAAALLVKYNVTGTFGLLDILLRDMKKIEEVLTVLNQFTGGDEDARKK